MKPDRATSAPPNAGHPDGFRTILAAAALIPLAATLVLFRLHVPLGRPGQFEYLYSPIIELRLRAVPFALLAGLVLVVGAALTGATAVWRRRLGLGLVAAGVLGLGVWSYVAPPSHFNQYFFNGLSPSQDGAFVLEAVRVDSTREYLSTFPQRALTPPEEMRGTRVISNPPGTTLLAIGVKQVLGRQPRLERIVMGPLINNLPPEEYVETIGQSGAVGIVLFWLLTGLWLLAAVPLYLLGRLFLPTPAAVALSVCCVFSPMTLMFTPGKDPAQLLTVALPLWLWFAAIRRSSMWAAAGAGAVFVVSCLFSLVHIWIGVIVLAATLLSTGRARSDLRRVLLRGVLPAIGAAVIGVIGLYVFTDLDFISTVRAVAASQSSVTRGSGAMPFSWQLLGVPLFLLFAGPAWWSATLLSTAPGERRRNRDADARLGRWLLFITAATMLGTIGFTNLETPRLWIPFMPLLLLGGFLHIGMLRQPTRRTTLTLAALVAVQITCAVAQWSLMDARATETRLVERQFFGQAPAPHPPGAHGETADDHADRR